MAGYCFTAFGTVPRALHEPPATDAAEAVELLARLGDLDASLGGEGTSWLGAELVEVWFAANRSDDDPDEIYGELERLAMRVETFASSSPG